MASRIRCVRLGGVTLVPFWTAALALVFAVAAPATASAEQPVHPPHRTSVSQETVAPPTGGVPSPTRKGGARSGMPCGRSAKACMSLSRGLAWLTDGAGHVVYGPVAAHGGSRHAATPVGTFRVLSKNAHYHSREFDAPMPYSVFFYPGDAFHADNPAVASNGCIHLTSSAAQRFYRTLRIGDPVQVVR